MKRNNELCQYEHHYYKEVSNKIVPIGSEEEQRKIDAFIKKNTTTPSRTARESGYSAYMFQGKKVEVNTSMVKKQKIDADHFLITRTDDAPTLPVSCLASTEHVVAMQDKVKDFKSELEPKTKHNVMYLISVSPSDNKMSIKEERKALLNLIQEYDEALNKDNISLRYNRKKEVFEIIVGTQVADIQLLVQALNNKYKIIDCDFTEIGLNQGICLVKKDASNPIHALVNIINSDSQKGFLERDAGTTSGRNTASYQDRNWTFNFFHSLDDMREKTDYPKNTLAIKIFNTN